MAPSPGLQGLKKAKPIIRHISHGVQSAASIHPGAFPACEPPAGIGQAQWVQTLGTDGSNGLV